MMVYDDAEKDMRPVIGIVPKYLSDTGYISVDDHYVQAVISAGGMPYVLPLTMDAAVYEQLLPMIDGFLLTGGKDINPARYGGDTENEALFEHVPVREQVECFILNYAHQFDAPVFGVCRGFQLINVFLGGTLYEDLPTQFLGVDEGGEARKVAWKHWQDTPYSEPSHFVQIAEDSRLHHILGTTRLHTNSMHHQGIRDLAPGLSITAYGPDGLIEGIDFPDRTFFMGVQWHPEFFAGEKSMGPLFEALVEASRAFRNKKRELDIHRGGLHVACEEKGGPWPEVIINL